MNNCEHFTLLRENIRQKALACGRDPDDVELIAVSKKQSLDKITSIHACGQKIFGENYLQEAQEKMQHCPHDLCWHFIGHLQSNKVAAAVEHFDVIQTVDRIKIARKIQLHASKMNKTQHILVQVNVGREKQKSGVLPEDAEELLTMIAQEPNIRVLGLMTMPPWSSDPEEARPYFRHLRELGEMLSGKGLFASRDRVELSMGMSGDYLVAIEEGATMVRIGTALFGTRQE